MLQMNRLLLRTTLGSLGALAATPALADTTVYSPGVLLAYDSRGADGRLAIGTEMTVNRLTGALSGWGALLQLEFDLTGEGGRIVLGGQGFSSGLGAEFGVAWHGGRELPGRFEVQLAPFASLGYVSLAGRLLAHAEGLDGGFALAGKWPIGGGESLIPLSGECPEEEGVVCGRPLRSATGHALRPTVRVGGATRASALRAAADALPPAARARLARAWLADAQDEFAAIAAFRQLAADLSHHGAPRRLIDAAQQAATDEVRHARRAFTIASALVGRTLRPLPMPRPRPVADLPTLATESWLDGAMNEGRAAAEARIGAETATVPAVAALQRAIGAEESTHAALGAAVAEWAARAGGRGARRALEAARDARSTVRAAHPAIDPMDRAWGRAA